MKKNHAMRTSAESRTRIAGVMTVIFLLAVSAKAEVKNFTFRGVIEYVSDPKFVLDGSITNGASFEGFYVFDTTVADSNADPIVGDYRFTNSSSGLALKVGSYVFRTNPRHVNFLIEIINGPDHDTYLLRSYDNVCSQLLTIDHISWVLHDVSRTTLTNDLLPVVPPELSAYDGFAGLTVNGACRLLLIRGRVTSISETPAAIPERPAVEIGDAVEVRWPSRLGYFYQIQSSEDGQSWTNVGEPVLGDGNVASRFFPSQPGRSMFYRVEIANFRN